MARLNLGFSPTHPLNCDWPRNHPRSFVSADADGYSNRLVLRAGTGENPYGHTTFSVVGAGPRPGPSHARAENRGVSRTPPRITHEGFQEVYNPWMFFTLAAAGPSSRWRTRRVPRRRTRRTAHRSRGGGKASRPGPPRRSRRPRTSRPRTAPGRCS